MQQVAPAITMPELDFEEIIELIRKEDSRFDRRAYLFTREGLDHAVKALKKRDSRRAGRSLHVTGPELLDGLRVFALEQFGPLAITVLNSWGVRSCSDFGDIVFSLIDYSVFSKTENDRLEDFAEVFDFEDAFVKPFRPKQPPPVGWSRAVLESV